MNKTENGMPLYLNDRTYEVENRVRAIHVDRADGCSFFREREGVLIHRRNCGHCIYARFTEAVKGEQTLGLCKFRM